MKAKNITSQSTKKALEYLPLNFVMFIVLILHFLTFIYARLRKEYFGIFELG